MIIFRGEEFAKIENPTPGTRHKAEILSGQHRARDLGGIFGIIVAGSQGNYHYHKERESIIIVISGEGAEILEGKEMSIKAGDVIFIHPGEKHMLTNKSAKDLRYLEFFTHPPVGADFVEVKK